jgi:aspartate/methionine/tyrosine aminotransferase
LRDAIAADLKRRKGLDYNPAQTETIVGNGAKQCVYQGIVATCGSGDAVVIPAPAILDTMAYFALALGMFPRTASQLLSSYDICLPRYLNVHTEKSRVLDIHVYEYI